MKRVASFVGGVVVLGLVCWPLALVGLFTPAAAAQVGISQPVTTFTCALNALAATLTQCQAAPAAGQKLYVTDIVVQTTTTTSGTFALQTGTGANCVTGTAALFPSSGTANRFNAPITTSPIASINFVTPLVAPAASAVCVIGVATNTISIQLNGYIKP